MRNVSVGVVAAANILLVTASAKADLWCLQFPRKDGNYTIIDEKVYLLRKGEVIN